MPVFNARDLLALPGGDNATDTLIGGVHFNKTTLERWGYSLYSNHTLSNGSWCLVVFEPYSPKLVYPNGTFINATWCYSPLNPIGPRAGTGVGFAAAFGVALMLVLANLRKHGRLHLPAERRFRPIGRRWQWYWAIFVCVAAFVSLFTNVDVDRYYVVELPIVLNVFFWFLMQQGTMALVWEAVRHWGSWKERQFVDPNPFALRHDDRRARFEFYAPLVFYLFLWLNFFMIVPRNWEPLELQRSPDQSLAEAAPVATGIRFKIAAFMLFACWAATVVHLWHSIKHYNPRNRGVLNRTLGCVRYVPVRFALMVPLALAVVAYQALASFDFSVSVLNVKGSVAAIYAGGYGPSLLVLLVQVVYGFLSPNEDRELLRQRRERGDAVDRELGIVHKPAWWRRVNGDHVESLRDRIARNVREIGGGRSTTKGVEQNIEVRAREAEAAAAAGTAIEMGALRRTGSAGGAGAGIDASRPIVAGAYGGRSDRRRSEKVVQNAATLLFPAGADAAGSGARSPAERRAELMMDGPPPYAERGRGLAVPGQGRPGTSERSNSTGTTNSITAPPQQVRSMLDI